MLCRRRRHSPCAQHSGEQCGQVSDGSPAQTAKDCYLLPAGLGQSIFDAQLGECAVHLTSTRPHSEAAFWTLAQLSEITAPIEIVCTAQSPETREDVRFSSPISEL
jgi:hypothetical protein